MRPPFEDALAYWTTKLREKRYSPNIRWVFHEHLCIKWPSRSMYFTLFYQTQWPTVSEVDAKRAYDWLVAEKSDIGFQLLVNLPDSSLCGFAFDPWDSGGEDHHVAWDIHFSPRGPYTSHREITNRWRWRLYRLLGKMQVSGLDFILRRRWV